MGTRGLAARRRIHHRGLAGYRASRWSVTLAMLAVGSVVSLLSFFSFASVIPFALLSPAGASGGLQAATPPSTGTQTGTSGSPTGTSGSPTGTNGSPTGTSSEEAGSTVPVQDTAYWVDTSTGAVYGFGGVPKYGSMAGRHLDKPIVGMASTPTGEGYWEVAADGGVFSFGSARFYGSEGDAKLAVPVVGIAATPTGRGYWLVSADGAVFSFGSARFYGSEGGAKLVAPVVGIAPTPTGHGYWLVSADGGVFSFGSARFYGSIGGHILADPVTGMAAMPTGAGYWLVDSDGSVFAFGGAQSRFYGSLGNQHVAQTVVGIATLYNGRGYWLMGARGMVTAFGSAVYWGSTSEQMAGTIVGIATGVGDGDPGPPSFQPASYGYDVSQYQCRGFPPDPHQIGVVEVAGWSYGALNPCLAQEVTWAAGGLNLYTFLSYGSSSTPEPGCAGNATVPTSAACDYGFGAAIAAFQEARALIGTRVDTSWWLDVERLGFSSSSPSTGASRSVVVGAFDALRYTEDINTVGFYFSLAHWNDIVGDYNPSAPLFPAWWTGPTPAYKCANARTLASSLHDTLPTGPILLVQYTDKVSGRPFDGDYAC